MIDCECGAVLVLVQKSELSIVYVVLDCVVYTAIVVCVVRVYVRSYVQIIKVLFTEFETGTKLILNLRGDVL